MPYKDKQRQREYQRGWFQRRRQQWIAANGGKCRRCGSTEDLEVDHIDPSSKRLEPRQLWSMALTNPRRIAELAKCQVLCSSCHLVKTHQDRSHGSLSD